MESSSDISSSDCSDSEDSFPGIDFKSNKKVLDGYLKIVNDTITQAYQFYEGKIANYKKENEEQKAELEKKALEISRLKSIIANCAEDKEEQNEEEEVKDIEFPPYQISAIVAYTMDRAYYNKCHNNPQAIIDDQIMRNYTTFKFNEKTPIYISIEDKTMKFGKYEIFTTMKGSVKIMHNFKKSVKLVNKHTFNIFKAYAEGLQKDDYDETKLEFFNHMFD